MENLNQNQKQVLAYLKANKANAFSPTQIGVAVGKKLPKSASTWSKPILEKLVEDGFATVAVDGTRSTYQFDPASASKAVITQQDIDETFSAEEIANTIAASIREKNGGSLDSFTSKKDKKALIEKLMPAAMKAYDKTAEEKIPAQYTDSLTKLVVSILTKAEKPAPKVKKAAAPKEKKIKEPTVYQTVDVPALTKEIKAAVKELGKDAAASDVNKTVRENTMKALKKEYKFNETNLRDKRTKAILHKIRVSLGMATHVNDNTDVEFAPGAAVKFQPHVSSNLGPNKAKGNVVTTFINDFGARFVVIKSGDKRITKRDKDVTLA